MSVRDPSADPLGVNLRRIGDYYTQMPCNCLTTYSDPERHGNDLYHAAPGEILDFCIRNLSKDVRLIHHYGNWDFAINGLGGT